nr:NAD(P)/FAD-dependent oxidoreductase [Nocardia sp. CNY236]
MATPSIIIIGAGFGGLGVAMELRRAGVHTFTILERADDLGGVWRDNTYPGAVCDVQSPLYCWSFAPKTWARRYAPHQDITAYMRDTAERFDLLRRIRFGTEVTDAEFDERSGTWSVHTADGAQLCADILIPAVGQLTRPALPSIPGVDTFTGPAFHSAEWNHDVDLAGKRIASIGTGASAVQYLPRIQPRAAHLTVFQRSAAWVLPKRDVALFDRGYAAFPRGELGLRILRLGIWLFNEALAPSLGGRPVAALANRHRATQIPDAGLRAKLTPDYVTGCKRVLFSNDYFPALTKPNVTVETCAIESITPTGIRTIDGVEHRADVIIYGTGFKATEFLAPITIRGLGGRALTDVWNATPHAYLGMCVPEFPNMFIVYGPNTNLGAGSVIYMLESQARYIRQGVRYLTDRPGRHLAVRADTEQRWDDWLQRRMKSSAWNFCSNWYQNHSGRIVNNWPCRSLIYRLKTRTFDIADYDEAQAPYPWLRAEDSPARAANAAAHDLPVQYPPGTYKASASLHLE